MTADPAIHFSDVSEGSIATDASPIRPDVVDAVTRAIHVGYPGVPVFPTMAVGASKERIPVADVRPAMA